MKKLLFFLAYGLTFVSAQGLTFLVSSSSGNYSLTCSYHQLTLKATSNYSAPVNYTWTSPSFSATGDSAVISTPGTYTISGMSGTVSATHTLSVFVNTVLPVSTGSPTFLVTGPGNYTFAALSPTFNVTHYVYSPMGGTFAATSTSITYYPGGTGPYVHCITNDANGCSSCQFSIPVFFITGSVGTYTTGLKVNEVAKDRIFPNPSNGLYTLELDDETQNTIEVFNSIGVLVKMHDSEKDGKVLDIREQPCGIYVIKLQDEERHTRYLKLIKE